MARVGVHSHEVVARGGLQKDVLSHLTQSGRGLLTAVHRLQVHHRKSEADAHLHLSLDRFRGELVRADEGRVHQLSSRRVAEPRRKDGVLVAEERRHVRLVDRDGHLEQVP